MRCESCCWRLEQSSVTAPPAVGDSMVYDKETVAPNASRVALSLSASSFGRLSFNT